MNTPLLLYIFIALATGAGISLASVALGFYITFTARKKPGDTILRKEPSGDAWIYDPYEIPDPFKKEKKVDIVSAEDDMPEPILSDEMMQRNARFLEEFGKNVVSNKE